MKKIGGKWDPDCKTMDGQKSVCLDKIFRDLSRGQCLVYSFGVGDDFTFELAMADMGETNTDIHLFNFFG